MSLLERLAEPAFAKDHLIRPSARILGFLIAAVSGLSCLAGVANLSYLFPLPSDDAITPLQIVVGALLPELLAAIGGIWMLTGDVRGKRLVLVAQGRRVPFRVIASEEEARLIALLEQPG